MDMLKKIVKVGIPAALQMCITSFSVMLGEFSYSPKPLSIMAAASARASFSPSPSQTTSIS